MSNTRIQTGAIEPIEVYAVDIRGKALTGLLDLYVRIRRSSNGQFLDWSDMTFKTSGHVLLNKPLTEMNLTLAPGVYKVVGDFNTSIIVNPIANDSYLVIPLQTPGTTAFLPGPGQIDVGGWADSAVNASAKIDSVATLTPNLAVTGSLLDRLCNKDITKTYDQATDSLQANRDRLG